MQTRMTSVRITVSGSFRRHWKAVKEAINNFKALGAEVVSPQSTEQERNVDEFVYLKGEEGPPEDIERRHLTSISCSDALYVVSPDGYLGPSTALEIGYALALKVPVWSSSRLRDVPHRFLVPVASEQTAFAEVKRIANGVELPSTDSLNELQDYYRHAAEKRGFDREKPEQVFVLLVEEVGELAKAIRAIIGVSVKADDKSRKSVRLELADCFLYLLHMANQLGINLYEAFREKERLNAEKRWSRPQM
jgi:NTP pyrophosphatase (non-canonical NTP hydrolase)/nucleoside 2-deoxyribosyltransferase